jgi:hypothetical protein
MGKVKGWAFEPTLTNEEKVERDDEKRRQADILEKQKQPADIWCKCKNCVVQDNPLDNVCCWDSENVREMFESEHTNCIREHHSFETICLNVDVLNMVRHDLMRFVKDASKKRVLRAETNKTYRFLSYRNFVSWTNSYIRLGKNNRVRLPACVLTRIREQWPEPSGCYQGFKPAEQMIDFEV